MTTKNKEVATKVQKRKDKYEVKNGKVRWQYKRGEIVISLDDLDQIFYQYSKHGLNMSQVQVQNEHGFDALQWQSLKRTFDLVKDSDVFSPYSLSQVTGKQACKMIADKIAEKHNPKNMRAVVAYEDRKQTKKAYEKAIKRVADLDYRFQIFETELLDYVSSAKPVKVRKTDAKKIPHGLIHVCDIHGGASVKPKFNLPAYNWKVLIQRLAQVAVDANAKGAAKQTVVINGDLIESFTGLNHINSWKGLTDNNGYGIDAVVEITKVLADWLQTIDNVHEVIVISGNHDRVTSSNKEDVEGQVAKIVAHTLRVQFQGQVTVTWDELIVRRKIGGVGFLFVHGDKALARKTTALINQYGYKGCYNVVVIGHLHSRNVVSDCLDHRVIYSPPIFSGNPYARNGGWSTLAGYLYLFPTNGAVTTHDYPLT